MIAAWALGFQVYNTKHLNEKLKTVTPDWSSTNNSLYMYLVYPIYVSLLCSQEGYTPLTHRSTTESVGHMDLLEIVYFV